MTVFINLILKYYFSLIKVTLLSQLNADHCKKKKTKIKTKFFLWTETGYFDLSAKN